MTKEEKCYKMSDIVFVQYDKKIDNTEGFLPFIKKNIVKTIDSGYWCSDDTYEGYIYFYNLFDYNLLGILNENNENQERVSYDNYDNTSNINIKSILTFSEAILLLKDVKDSNIDRVKLLSQKEISVNDIVNVWDCIKDNNIIFGYADSEKENEIVKKLS